MNWTPLLIGFVLSVPAGWFAAVLDERVPDNKSLFKPFPGFHLSRRRVWIQVVTTILFVATFARFSDAPPLVLFAYLLFFTAAVALSAIDLVTLRLPDRIVGPLLMISIVLVVVASLLNHDAVQIRFALLGGAVYFGFLLLAHLVMPAGMGFGDVKLSAVMGLYVGWVTIDGLGAVTATLYAMIIGFVVGSAAGIVVFAFRRGSKPYPFGPFLLFGATVVIFASPQLLTSVA
jgi:leader peptidase (prepilin peptidase)/N-methyltransferase